MLFVYVPERNIYFVSTEEGTTYAYQRAFKEKIISYIAHQYQEPEKNWIFMEFMGKIWRRQGGLSKMYQKPGKDRKKWHIFHCLWTLRGGKCL